MNAIAMSTEAAEPVAEKTAAVFANIRHIFLSKLVPSAANVRRVQRIFRNPKVRPKIRD